MREWLETYKPRASARWHLLLAALLWTLVGMLLLLFGSAWVLQANVAYTPVLLTVAVVAGLAKTWLVLNRTARRIVDRIRSRGDGRCLGGFLSVRTWLFVAGMMAAGRWLRTGPTPKAAVGLVYVAVGIALLLGSRILWQAWRQRTNLTGQP
jgi:hypothetical protein